VELVIPDQPIGRFDSDSGEFVLTQRWHCLLGNGKVLEIDAGFSSDGASIPKWAQTGVSPRWEAASFPAALCHDSLYMAELLERKHCDLEFYRLLRLFGMAAWRAELYYYAVRLFGWIVWRKHTKQSITEARKKCRIVSSSYQYL
jgi:hypothetical protein